MKEILSIPEVPFILAIVVGMAAAVFVGIARGEASRLKAPSSRALTLPDRKSTIF